MDQLKHFEKLNAINVGGKVKEKQKLKYLSWVYAWEEVKKVYPDANYEIQKFNGLPYIYDELTGYMVFTNVTIEGTTHEMWLPVMDGANKAMKANSYTYQVAEYNFGKKTGNYIDKTVEAATMFDINKAIMRCLTKNLAMFGLGLYIYAGEDLPEEEKMTRKRKVEEEQEQAKQIENNLKETQDEIVELITSCGGSKNDELMSQIKKDYVASGNPYKIKDLEKLNQLKQFIEQYKKEKK